MIDCPTMRWCQASGIPLSSRQAAIRSYHIGR